MEKCANSQCDNIDKLLVVLENGPEIFKVKFVLLLLNISHLSFMLYLETVFRNWSYERAKLSCGLKSG